MKQTINQSTSVIKQAVIMAGGLGTRISKYIPDMPKCMMAVAGKPVLQYQIEWLKSNKISNVIICIGYKGHQIKDYFKDGKEFGVNISYHREQKLLGTAGALREIRHRLEPRFLYMLGDQIICDAKLSIMRKKHTQTGGFIIFNVHDDFHPYDSDRIAVNRAGRVLDFGNVEGQTNTSIFIANRKIVDYIPKGKCDMSRDIIPKIIRHKECYAVEMKGYIKDIGAPERYADALAHINDIDVLFVYPNMFTPYAFSQAIMLLSAVLKKKGLKSGLMHINDEHGIPDKDDIILHYAKSFNPKLIAFTCTSFEFDRAKQIAKFMKNNMDDVTIILGGPHATIAPEDLKDSPFDAFCIGEGEEALVEFIRKFKYDLSVDNIKSFWIKKGNKIIKNPMMPIIQDLNLLPYLDLDIMDIKKLLMARQGWFSLSMSRGCPFDCSFCINHLYKKIKGRNIPIRQYLRKFNPYRAVEELGRIVQRFCYDIDVFNFDDDLIMLSEIWMKGFTGYYKQKIYKKYDIKYAINARATTLSDIMVDYLADSGCKEVRIGVESGSSRIRYDILNKPITDEQIKTAFYNCQKKGLRTTAFVMIGMPTETRNDVLKTMRLMIRLKPTLMRLSILYPYKHTKLYDYCRQHGLFRKNYNLNDVFSDTPLKFKDMSRNDIVRYHTLYPWYLNLLIYPNSAYAGLIKKYRKCSAEELRNSLSKIKKEDMGVDKKIRKPHFRFFKGNPYYIEYAG